MIEIEEETIQKIKRWMKIAIALAIIVIFLLSIVLVSRSGLH